MMSLNYPSTAITETVFAGRKGWGLDEALTDAFKGRHVTTVDRVVYCDASGEYIALPVGVQLKVVSFRNAGGAGISVMLETVATDDDIPGGMRVKAEWRKLTGWLTEAEKQAYVQRRTGR